MDNNKQCKAKQCSLLHWGRPRPNGKWSAGGGAKPGKEQIANPPWDNKVMEQPAAEDAEILLKSVFLRFFDTDDDPDDSWDTRLSHLGHTYGGFGGMSASRACASQQAYALLDVLHRRHGRRQNSACFFHPRRGISTPAKRTCKGASKFCTGVSEVDEEAKIRQWRWRDSTRRSSSATNPDASVIACSLCRVAKETLA